MLKRQLARLTTLVLEMLDVSRITGRGLDLAPGPVDLAAIVREVVERFELEIERRHVTVDGERERSGARGAGTAPASIRW